MDRTCRVSVIVPIYNAEQYLRPCIDSVLAQTLTDWELLLVDDGSQDGSAEICAKYAEQEVRIFTICTENCGVSHARNVGLARARGEYVFFLDADDCLMPWSLEVCLAKIESTDVDIVCAECEPIYEDGASYPAHRPIFADEELTHADYLKRVLSYRTLCSIWAKLYRRESLGTIRFDEESSRGQDVLFLYKLLSSTKGKVLVCSDRIYQYRILQQSASHGSYEQQSQKIHGLVEKLQKEYETGEDQIKPYLAYAVCYSLTEMLTSQGWIKYMTKADYILFRQFYCAYRTKMDGGVAHVLISTVHYPLLSLVVTLYYLPDTLKRILKRTLLKHR